jgi:predicted DNA-binding transcriptional regulator AlpA
MREKEFAKTLTELLTPVVQQSIKESIRESLDDMLKEGKIQPPEKSDLMFIDETAQLIGMKKSSLYTNLCRGVGHPPGTRQGKRWYFSRREVMAWIQTGRKK